MNKFLDYTIKILLIVILCYGVFIANLLLQVEEFRVSCIKNPAGICFQIF